MSEVRLAAEARTEFGKGAARRTRRAGKIPAVLYGHGSDPKHLALPALEFARVIREQGQNAVLTLEIDSNTELALTKTVTTHPIKNYIEHVDLLLVQRGEKVTVEVPLVITGEAQPGNLVTQDLTTLEVSVEALHIPDQFELPIDGFDAGTQIFAKDVKLPVRRRAGHRPGGAGARGQRRPRAPRTPTRDRGRGGHRSHRGLRVDDRAVPLRGPPG